MDTIKHTFAYCSLYRYISRMEVVDCHEHLHPEAVRTAMPVDFSTLLAEYSAQDLLNAGMSAQAYAAFFDSKTPPDEKWTLLEPYLPAIETTSYYRAVRLSLKRFYGEKALTAQNYRRISAAMQRRNTAGVYEETLAASRIRCAMVSSFPRMVRPEQLTGRCRYVPMYWVCGTPADHGLKRRPACLEDLEAEADEYIALALQGAKVLKLSVEHLWRPVTREQAVAALKTCHTEPDSFSADICWYFVELLLQRCAKHDIPVTVHTGYWRDYRVASPDSYMAMVDSHPENRFDLFHLGYPYVRQSLLLAKSRPNVCIDLCWVYIISQELARDAIRQIVDFVPMNKVMGFGADYFHIDNVYGHRKMMDRTVALALADKVADGTLTLAQAKRWAKAMLWDNPVRFYGIKE